MRIPNFGSRWSNTKYLGNSSLWLANNKVSSSVTWRSIIKAIDSFRGGFKMRLGCGSSSLWYTDWLGVGPLCNILDYVHIADIDLSVKDLWRHEVWDMSGLSTTLPPSIREHIL